MEANSVSLTEFQQIRKRIAAVLLHHAGANPIKQPCISRREIAAILGTSWTIINLGLESLQTECAIRINRHRMSVNQEVLKRIVNCS